MDDAMIVVWNGKRWMAYEPWLATAPLVREEPPAQSARTIPADAVCVAGVCGEQRIWLIKDGERWLLMVGSRKASGRRRDFASPFLAHAIRTAEAWYGAPRDGWRGENREAKGIHEAASVPPQDPDHAEAARE
jgi:hypothetical protein